MKYAMKKMLALCLLLTALPLSAFAAVRLPAQRGVVTDDANVLSAQTAADIAEYAQKVEDETDVRLHVAIVHFLDGMEARTYAQTLFEKWELGKEDVLLLGAADEDSFATAMGAEAKALLGEKNAENLLYTSSTFSALFRSQQYDAAFNAYFTAFNALLEKQTGERISLGKLFGNTQAAATQKAQAQAYGSQLWDEVMDAIRDSSEDYQVYHEQHESRANGLSAGGWIVLAVLILIIFGQSDPVRKARRGRNGSYRSYGCGCSPLGWLFSLFGLNVLIDAFRRKR